MGFHFVSLNKSLHSFPPVVTMAVGELEAEEDVKRFFMGVMAVESRFRLL